jgi:hypothetical protein
MVRFRNAFTTACLALLLGACSWSDDPVPEPTPDPVVNRAPTAVADADTDGTVDQIISLSAAASSDPDGDTLTFAWTITSGPAAASLTSAASATASFTATAAGTYVVQVVVTDPSSATSTDSMTLTIGAPPSTTALTLSGVPAHGVAGDPINITITLPAPAGSAGLTINLLSDAPAVVPAPASVQVMAGERSITVQLEPADAGAVRITASAAGLDAATAGSTIDPRVLDVSLSTDAIMVGGTAQVTVTLRAPAPAGGTRVSLAISNASRATLAASQVDIAPGASAVTTSLTALAQGGAVITAMPPSGVSASSVRLVIAPMAASSTSTSVELIDSALTAGTLSSEQALVYKVFAAFGVDALPAQYRGNDFGQLDSGVINEAVTRLPALSATNQQAIGKYLFPPIYSGSWGEVLKPSVGKAVRAQAIEVSCFGDLAGMPRDTTLDGWNFIRTRSFKIWYPSTVVERNAPFYNAGDIVFAAQNVSATIQKDYDRLIAVFGNTPIPDTNVTCNGGDSAIDVYVTRVGLGAKAQVMPHLPGACAVPGWIWIAPDAVLDSKDARNIVAHELVHLFQQPVARQNCDAWAYNILDEATASWAFDKLYPADNYEWKFASNGRSGYFDGASGEWLVSPVLANPRASAGRGCYGYCDYVLFEWLDRKYGSQAIRNVVEATGFTSAMRSYEVGLAGVGGGLPDLWPAFALAQWNDSENHVQDEWNGWEHDPHASIRASYVKKEGKAISIKLDGANKIDASQKVYDALAQDNGGALDAMTTMYVNLKFEDDGISRVHFEPRGDFLHGSYSRFRLQAIQKINGEWKPAEDWSTKHEINYCRDKKAERIEELVIVYSNSHAGDVPFDTNPPAKIAVIESSAANDPKMPKLTASNVSCMPWTGTSSVHVDVQYGGFIDMSATSEWEPYVSPVNPGDPPLVDSDSPYHTFVPKSGTARYEQDSYDIATCRYQTPPVTGPITIPGNSLLVNSDTRTVTGVGISTVEGAMFILDCPGGVHIEVPGPAGVTWLAIPVGVPLSEDGRSFKGSTSETNAATGTVTTRSWDFSSAREE